MPDNRRVPGPEESQDPITFLKSSERPEKPDLVRITLVCRMHGVCLYRYVCMCVTLFSNNSWTGKDAEGTAENKKRYGLFVSLQPHKT